jgi:hypothetical protein
MKDMFKRWAVVCLALLMPAVAAQAADVGETFSAFKAGSNTTIDHSAFTRLLSNYVVPGADGINRVRYGAFKAEGLKDLKAYIATLEAADVASLDRPEQFAFWANLYNAKTLDIVLDHYPVKSIKDINLGGSVTTIVTGGPWKAQTLKVAGQSLSLDDVEHGILRKVFKEPRVHYIVNCASIGCPNLGQEALTSATLDARLTAGAKAYINNPRGLKVENGSLKASSIYNWFKADFGGAPEGVLAHARTYAEPALKRELESITTIDAYGYDWSLNDLKN